jgi:hypothetical protein
MPTTYGDVAVGDLERHTFFDEELFRLEEFGRAATHALVFVGGGDYGLLTLERGDFEVEIELRTDEAVRVGAALSWFTWSVRLAMAAQTNMMRGDFRPEVQFLPPGFGPFLVGATYGSWRFRLAIPRFAMKKLAGRGTPPEEDPAPTAVATARYQRDAAALQVDTAQAQLFGAIISAIVLAATPLVSFEVSHHDMKQSVACPQLPSVREVFGTKTEALRIRYELTCSNGSTITVIATSAPQDGTETFDTPSFP